MGLYRYEIWKYVSDGDQEVQHKPYRIIEHFPVCDGGLRARITDKCYASLAEARHEKKRLEETQ